jgi:hypothetical protein
MHECPVIGGCEGETRERSPLATVTLLVGEAHDEDEHE